VQAWLFTDSIVLANHFFAVVDRTVWPLLWRTVYTSCLKAASFQIAKRAALGRKLRIVDERLQAMILDASQQMCRQRRSQANRLPLDIYTNISPSHVRQTQTNLLASRHLTAQALMELKDLIQTWRFTARLTH
jgi:hypothetical protein